MQDRRAMLLQVAWAFVFRFTCYAVMLRLALWAEARPAPLLHDEVLARVPYVESVARWNYVLWLAVYLPVALVLWLKDWRRFCRYMVSSGLLALVRGGCIALTAMGRLSPVDHTAGLSLQAQNDAFWGLANPLALFFGPTTQVYLTKDLFFSGHTATTLLLLLYVWPWPRLRAWSVVGHVLVVVSLFFAHLHYSIDVVGAWAIAFGVYVLREWPVGNLLKQKMPSN